MITGDVTKFYRCHKKGEKFNPQEDSLQGTVAGAEIIAQMCHGDNWHEKGITISPVWVIEPAQEK